ncbi:MAG: hypothetical protein KFW07_01755 [Mycoplasmataceae bacterium]|nr:hypothetical protein [Mycoplasmataceae bacterium]
MKILLACSAGMSTSLLEASIRKYAESIGETIDVVAKPSGEEKKSSKIMILFCLAHKLNLWNNLLRM